MNSVSNSKVFRILTCIPTYNNAGTLYDVVSKVRRYTKDVLVVNDGSTDKTEEILRTVEGISILTIEKNRGKGNALKEAFQFATANNYQFLLTFDADGQHHADNIPDLIAKVENGAELVIGVREMGGANNNVPFASKFGRIFSNFWVLVETGKYLHDTQTGFRIYPVDSRVIRQVGTNNYDFEIELLVNMIWKGYIPEAVAIKVFYPPPSERVSHFDKVKDNILLSKLHTQLVFKRALGLSKRMFK